MPLLCFLHANDYVNAWNFLDSVACHNTHSHPHVCHTQGVTDERELKRMRRKQSNRESARRSRLRKQAECEALGRQVKDLVTGGWRGAAGGRVAAQGHAAHWAPSMRLVEQLPEMFCCCFWSSSHSGFLLCFPMSQRMRA
jgi:hypothetical protein